MIKPIQNLRLLHSIFGNELYIIKEDRLDPKNIVEKEEQTIAKTSKKEDNKANTRTQQITFPLAIAVAQTLLEAQKMFLEKVLKAIDLDFDKIYLITEKIDSTDHLPSSKLLVFGTGMLSSDINRKKYEIAQEENLQIVQADDLVKISQDVSKKRQLWEVLQELTMEK